MQTVPLGGIQHLRWFKTHLKGETIIRKCNTKLANGKRIVLRKGDEVYVGVDAHKKDDHVAVLRNGREVATWVMPHSQEHGQRQKGDRGHGAAHGGEPLADAAAQGALSARDLSGTEKRSRRVDLLEKAAQKVERRIAKDRQIMGMTAKSFCVTEHGLSWRLPTLFRRMKYLAPQSANSRRDRTSQFQAETFLLRNRLIAE